jgi:hypothetical protein
MGSFYTWPLPALNPNLYICIKVAALNFQVDTEKIMKVVFYKNLLYRLFNSVRPKMNALGKKLAKLD